MSSTRTPGKRPKGLVLLKDLIPRKDPKGGAAKSVFGQRPVVPPDASPAPPARPAGKKK